MIFFGNLLIPMAKTKKSVSTSTYNDVIIKPKRNGKASLVINHEYAGEMANMHEKNLKKYGDSIISYKPYDEDEFCSFKIQKIKSSSDQMIIKGKKGNCGNLPLPFGSTTVSFAWGYDSYGKAVEAAEGLLDLSTLVDY